MSGQQDWDCFGPGSRHCAALDHVETTRSGGMTEMHIYRCGVCAQYYGYHHIELSDWSTLTGSDFSDVTEIWTPLDPDELEGFRRDPNYKPRSDRCHRRDSGWR